jgi:Icc-related predicted phosphoesterase
MLLAKWHRKALKGVEMWSAIQKRRKEGAHYMSDFLQVPTRAATSGDNNPCQACTRIVCISDTHGKHRDISYLPEGDILVHAGDFTKYGETSAIEDLSRYFELQRSLRNYQEIVCIAGNHDISFHPEYFENTWSRRYISCEPSQARDALQNCRYLEDSAARLPLENNSQQPVVVYGSPWTPAFFQWAFNLQRGEALRQVWSKIPTSTDILVTHGPPQGRGDITLHSGHFGCTDLLQEIQHRVKPRLHIYGHIHEGYGTSFDGHTLFVNASSLDLAHQANNPPIVIDLPQDTRQPAMVVQPHCPYIHDQHDWTCWLLQNGYSEVASIIRSTKADLTLLFVNNNALLLSESAFQHICDKLKMRRRKHHLLRMKLQRALNQLYSESFFQKRKNATRESAGRL